MGVVSLFLVLVCAYPIFSQENAGTNVSPSLEICYNTTLYLTRDYRLPATITVLVDLIRKIEDGNTINDLQELSVELLQRFRQDGIKKTRWNVDSKFGLPYSPKGVESYKNRVQLKVLTPGQALNFNNDSINTLEACSLHYMVSSTIEKQRRGDENAVCNRIARYTSRIHKRETEFSEATEERNISTCPIESGVIYTKWGAVKAGLVLSGIAAGLKPMKIKRSNGSINTIWASTIAGELSEAGLNQPSDTKVVGNKGGWNSTLLPRYYFLDKNDVLNTYLTDAEIRGGLDGLFIGLSIGQWRQANSKLKISQILDLYYGRGVFNDSARACNRKNLMQNILQRDVLVQQTTLFNSYLDEYAQYGYSPKEQQFPVFAQNAADALTSYLSNMNDLQCSAEYDSIERVATDILIFVDTTWDYNIVAPFLSYLLENIDVNKYESSYTLFDGTNANLIVNKTRSILDFYEKYNLTQQQNYPTGFDYRKVVSKAEALFKAKLNNETELTGQSTILLMIPHNTPSADVNNWITDKRNEFKRVLPDLKIIVAGSGAKSSYNSLVNTPNNDIFQLADSTDESTIKETARAVIDKLKKLPRSVVNPKCGSNFNSGTNNFEVVQYVEPSGVNYHKISPNYFYNGKNLKIKGQGYGTLVVCTSRTEANPRANSTGSGAKCQTINSDEVSIEISSYCTGDSTTDCAPIYISVEGKKSQLRCSENTCRFPDNIKYSIFLENVQCSSSAEKLFSSFIIASLLFLVMRL